MSGSDKKSKKCTDAELLLLGLVAEMPRHGYELDQVIKERGMREWTQIGFSSIYFVLGKLKELGLVRAKKDASGSNARKVYSLTASGRRMLALQTSAALSEVRPSYSSVLLGMINWPVLNQDQALQALQLRIDSIESEITRLNTIAADQQPMPDYLDALFEYSIGQLKAEARWVTRTMAYMMNKPWLE